MIDKDTILKDCFTNFSTAEGAALQTRNECLQDRSFVDITGSMYERFDSQFPDNIARFEINILSAAVDNVIRAYYQNTPTILFSSDSGKLEDVELAEIATDRFRHDANTPKSKQSRLNAFKEAVRGGFGALVVETEYVDPDNPDNDTQRICIDYVEEADRAVFWGGCAREDKSDANECWVIWHMSTADFKEEYPDVDFGNSTFPQSIDRRYLLGWYYDVDKPVKIAHYYRREKVKRTFDKYQDITQTQIKSVLRGKDQQDTVDALIKDGWNKIGSRRHEVTEVTRYTIGGFQIIDEVKLPCKTIPVVPVTGHSRVVVNDRESYRGIVRMAKDAQILKNITTSRVATLSSISMPDTPVVDAEAIAPFSEEWQTAHIKLPPFLRIKPVTDAAGQRVPMSELVTYAKGPTIPQATAAILQQMDQDVNTLLGYANPLSGATQQTQSGEWSGFALDLLQNNIDERATVYLNNAGEALLRCAEIWLEMAPHIYIEPNRNLEIAKDSGQSNRVSINIPSDVSETGYDKDFAATKFSASYALTPPAASRKQGVVKTLISLNNVVPESQKPIVAAFLLAALEGDGLGDLSKYGRSLLIKDGLIEPNEKEAAALAETQQAEQNKPPSPTDQLTMSIAAKEEATAKERLESAALKNLQADKTRVEVLAMLDSIDLNKFNHLVQLAEKLESMDMEKQLQQQQLQQQQQQQLQQAIPQQQVPIDNAGTVQA